MDNTPDALAGGLRCLSPRRLRCGLRLAALQVVMVVLALFFISALTEASPNVIRYQEQVGCERAIPWLDAAWADVQAINKYSRSRGGINGMTGDEMRALQTMFQDIADQYAATDHPLQAAELNAQIVEWGQANVATFDTLYEAGGDGFLEAQAYGTEQAWSMLFKAQLFKQACGLLGTRPFVSLPECFGREDVAWWERTKIRLRSAALEFDALGDRLSHGEGSAEEVAALLEVTKAWGTEQTNEPVPESLAEFGLIAQEYFDLTRFGLEEVLSSLGEPVGEQEYVLNKFNNELLELEIAVGNVPLPSCES